MAVHRSTSAVMSSLAVPFPLSKLHGFVEESGMKGKYQILLASLYDRSRIQNAEKPGNPLSATAILSSRQINSITSNVSSHSVFKLSRLLMLSNDLDFYLSLAVTWHAVTWHAENAGSGTSDNFLVVHVFVGS